MHHFAQYEVEYSYEEVCMAPHHDFEFLEHPMAEPAMFSGFDETGQGISHYSVGPASRHRHGMTANSYPMEYANDSERYLEHSHATGIVYHHTKPVFPTPNDTPILGYPSCDRDDVESDTSSGCSYSVGFNDDPLSPNPACTPYFQTTHWSSTPMPFPSGATMHAGGSFVNPREIAQELPADDTMDEDIDAEGEDEDTELQQHWNQPTTEEDPPTPDLVDAATGPSSDDDNDPPYNPHGARSRARPSRPQRRANRRTLDAPSKPSSDTKSSKSAAGKRRPSGTSSTPISRRSRANIGNARPFPCPFAPYGCPATFPSKNEWKRHVSTQHVKEGLWRCELCPPTPPSGSFNDFNRKDLFTQHLKRMHAHTLANDNVYIRLATDLATVEGANLEILSVLDRNQDQYPIAAAVIVELVRRCFTVIRSLPTRCRCPVTSCNKAFHGETAWDDRMEHLAGHLERGRRAGAKPAGVDAWSEDEDLSAWLVEEGLVERDGKGNSWRLGDGRPRRDAISLE